MRVLVAEDDRFTRDGLTEILEAEGYTTVAVPDGGAALAAFNEQKPDFVCLDVMMPDCDGYEVCRRIRAADQQIPIIFISAKSEEIDKVIGLELGADDFIVKPFGVKEVVARIRAVTRRCLSQTQSSSPPPLSFADGLVVHPNELRARRGEEVIELSYRDCAILQLLHKSAGKVLTRLALFQQCWGQSVLSDSRTVDQHIAQLRKKVEQDPKSPVIIQTVHGVGYRSDG